VQRASNNGFLSFKRRDALAPRLLGLRRGSGSPKLIHGGPDPRDDLAASALEAEIFHRLDEELLVRAGKRVGTDPANDFDEFAVRVGVDRLVAPDIRPLAAARLGAVLPVRPRFDQDAWEESDAFLEMEALMSEDVVGANHGSSRSRMTYKTRDDSDGEVAPAERRSLNTSTRSARQFAASGGASVVWRSEMNWHGAVTDRTREDGNRTLRPAELENLDRERLRAEVLDNLGGFTEADLAHPRSLRSARTRGPRSPGPIRRSPPGSPGIRRSDDRPSPCPRLAHRTRRIFTAYEQSPPAGSLCQGGCGLARPRIQ